jgi:hypothetical protein
MLKGKVYTDLHEVAVFLYKNQGRWYSKLYFPVFET